MGPLRRRQLREVDWHPRGLRGLGRHLLRIKVGLAPDLGAEAHRLESCLRRTLAPTALIKREEGQDGGACGSKLPRCSSFKLLQVASRGTGWGPFRTIGPASRNRRNSRVAHDMQGDLAIGQCDSVNFGHNMYSICSTVYSIYIGLPSCKETICTFQYNCGASTSPAPLQLGQDAASCPMAAGFDQGTAPHGASKLCPASTSLLDLPGRLSPADVAEACFGHGETGQR